MIYWHIPNFVWWLLGPLVAWRIGVRIYRLIARQHFSEPRHWFRAGSLGALTVFVACVAFEEHTAFWALGVGLALGAILGVIDVRLTALDFRGQAAFFEPNRFLGFLLTVLLVGRIVWRLLLDPPSATLGWNLAEFVRNPSTMFLFGLFSAHYLAYSVGIVYWVKKQPVPKPLMSEQSSTDPH